jgi:hypothetical protein
MPAHPITVAIPASLLLALLGCGENGPAQPTLPAPPAPASLVIVSGDHQAGTISQTLPKPILVEVRDSAGTPMTGLQVTFQVLAGGGTVSADTDATDITGRASVEWTLGPTAGAEQVVLIQAVRRLSTGRLLYATASAVAQLPPTPLTFEAVGAGALETCGLTTDHLAYCWGIGFGTGYGNSVVPVATAVVGGLTFTRLSVGYLHTCALTPGGAAWCWGTNFTGAIGDGTTTDADEPRAVSGGLTFQDLAAGYLHTCAIAADGAAWCWGNNQEGELGDGTSTDRRVPGRVAGGLTFRVLAAGERFTCGLTPGGAAWCWGQMVDATSTVRQVWGPVPVAVAGPHSFVALTAGAAHACGLTGEGRAFCWGWNGSGEFGDGTTTSSAVPVPAGGGAAYRAISGGYYHTCGLSLEGAPTCWGWNDEYDDSKAFNDGVSIHSLSPEPLPGGLILSSLDQGELYGCGVAPDRKAWCWFENIDGSLGNGNISGGSYRPVEVH